MKNGEQSAFPLDGNSTGNPQTLGLTKREYFTGLAMQGLLVNYINNGQYGNHQDYPMISDIAIRVADEILNKLEQVTPE